MKKSIFKDGSICYGVDYSNRPDILEVVEITQQEYIEETTPKEDYSNKYQFKKVIEIIEIEVEGEIEQQEIVKLIYLGSSNVVLPDTTDFREDLSDENLAILQNNGYIQIINGLDVFVGVEN